MEVSLHPDANQMSALLGGELQGRARRAVMAHLGQCPECRQWAGLAHSARRAVMPATAPAPSRRPWSIYAIPAAAALALVGALWLRPALIVTAPAPPSAAAGVARHFSPVHPLAPARRVSAAPPKVVKPAPPLAADVLVVPIAPPHAAAVATLAALPGPSAPSGEFQPSIDFSPLMTGFQDQPEAASEVEFASQFLTGNDDAALVSSTAVVANSVPAVLATPYAQGFVPTARRTQHLTGPYAPRRTPTLDGGLGWTVSRGGAVLHSVGAGIWAAVPLVPGLHFRAVFAAASHIWAGADASQLFASNDRGAHWRRLPLPEPNPHAAHIESIEFSDAHRGFVRLDNGHVWVTADGGATWAAPQQTP
ncbi:MAG TPA: zf-HC2 domain-containing protein [Terriglobales bacterium]|jgi:hypothetical protein